MQFRNTFRSLNTYNYRLWAIGAVISNVGTWMQRVGQDWLVLTQLTHHNAAAVGIVMGLQFGPQVLLLPFTGSAADHLDRRKILICTQTAMGVLALGLGLLTVMGIIQLWEVYGFALLLGIVTAFDAPARQAFVSDLVEEKDLSNAVGLNSTSFNGARMIGPAAAGILIASIGTGWVFIVNAVSFGAVIWSLFFLRLNELHIKERQPRKPGSFAEGFRYLRGRPDLKTILLMLFIFGTFSLNFPIFISTMAVTAFHAGAREYGVLSSEMAIGSVTGALLAARRENPQIVTLCIGAGVFSVALLCAAMMPTTWLFGLLLIIVGAASQTFTTSGNSTVQITTDPQMRGRVLAILIAILMGGTPIGAPIVGWVVDRFGPRSALVVGAVAAAISALIGLKYVLSHRRGEVLNEIASQGNLDEQLLQDEPSPA